MTLSRNVQGNWRTIALPVKVSSFAIRLAEVAGSGHECLLLDCMAADCGTKWHVQWFGRPVENASGMSLLCLHSSRLARVLLSFFFWLATDGCCVIPQRSPLYHAARNHFEGFGFLNFQQIRIRFSSLRIFLNDSNFRCVQGSITCNETVHVHVLCLLMIHVNIYSYVNKYFSIWRYM